MSQTLFIHARLFDGTRADCPEGVSVLVEDDRIREVSERPVIAPSARVVDGDPLADIGLLAAHGERLSLVMRGGELVKNTL